MKPSILFIVRFIVMLFPDTRFFSFKRGLYRLAGAELGKNVRICSSARIIGNGNLSIGENTWIGHESMIVCSSNVTIGANVDIAPRVYIGTGTHEIDLRTPGIAGKGISKDIKIGDGCWLCVNSSILPNVEIGEKSVVAAGAVVTKNFESYTLLAGVPAKVIKSLK